MKKLLTVLLAVMLLSTVVSCSKSESGAKSGALKFATIGTGGVTGTYYPTGGSISKIVNKKSDVYNLKVTVESTGGSVFNVNAIIAGDLEFGMVQSDRQYQAYSGTAEWADKGKQETLRAVCSIYPESITLLAADDAGITDFESLKGKVVNIGNPGSGNRGNAIETFKTYGMDWEKDITPEGLKPSECAKMLQDGRIDAYFYTVGHPNGSFKEATAGTRKTHFVSIDKVDNLLAEYPYFAKSTIPVKYYPNATNKEDAVTYGVKATLCTSSDVSDDIVYAITKEVFDNIEDFKTLHPAFADITKESMLTGLSAPIHEGAMKYYKEVGLK